MPMGSDDFDRDILDIIPERFDADADSSQARAGYRLRAIITLIIAVAAVGGLVAAGWHFLGNKSTGGPGIPVITADERPIKTRPDDRGGMQVPNQDKLVYERMDATAGGARVEQLLPPPERPVLPQVADAPAQAPRAATGTEIIRPPYVPAARQDPPAPKPVPLQPVVAEPVAKPLPKPEPAPKPQVAAAPAPAPPPPPTPVKAPVVTAPTALPEGDYLVQLGALRTQDAAERAWTGALKVHGDLLGGLKPDIMRVDLGDKGTFWRVRAGTLSEKAAKQLCAQLKDRNQGCLIARK